jgi:hypothetical protein
MEWFISYGLTVIVSILVFLFVNLDSAFWAARKRGDFDDPFIKQAKIDQQNADYPGCRAGFMECRSMSCWCNEAKPHRDFVKERAKMLRDNK